MKRALVIGIDDYPNAPLTGCVNDAIAVAQILETNGDGSPNFDVVAHTSNINAINADIVNNLLDKLFEGSADTALFYFAGHGIIDPATNAGYIVTQDGRKGAWGISLSDILARANRAHPEIKSTIIILDSCHSGFAGEIAGLGANGQPSVIGNGVTILTACHREGAAEENSGQGLFTELLLDALKGSAADVCGRAHQAPA